MRCREFLLFKIYFIVKLPTKTIPVKSECVVVNLIIFLTNLKKIKMTIFKAKVSPIIYFNVFLLEFFPQTMDSGQGPSQIS